MDDMKTVRKILIIIMCAVFLTGCGQKITEGEIYKKEFLPAYTTTRLTPIIHSNGKTTFTTYIPMVFRYPDRYAVYIRSLESDDKGKKETAVYYTTKEIFEQCEIGDMFSYDEGRDFDEEPVEKSEKE